MFKVPFFAGRDKPVAERCRTDANTRLRLRYAPYYNVVEEADGLNITVDGRRMIMMSSNEYLGLSNHPEVRRAAKAAIDAMGHQPVRLAAGQRLARRTTSSWRTNWRRSWARRRATFRSPGTCRACRASRRWRSARTRSSWTRASTPRCGTACG